MKILIAMFALSLGLQAQTVNGWRTSKVVAYGTSLDRFQQTWLQSKVLPLLFPGNVVDRGHDSWTCDMLTHPSATFSVPANTNAVLVYATGTDMLRGTPASEWIPCAETLVQQLIGQNSNVAIVMGNQHAFDSTLYYQCNGGDPRPLVKDYNDAVDFIAGEFPANVTVLDAYDATADYSSCIDGDPGQCWAAPGLITDCDHPGPPPPNNWVPGWSSADGGLSPLLQAEQDAVYSALQAHRRAH